MKRASNTPLAEGRGRGLASAMPSKNPPISLRLTPGLLKLVDERATNQGLTRHAAIVALVSAGLSVTAVTAQAPKVEPAPKPRRRWTLDVPLGPAAHVPGSRLKGGGLHPKKR